MTRSRRPTGLGSESTSQVTSPGTLSGSRLAARIAGDADRLSGCHLSVYDDLDTILAHGESIRDRYQLRLASHRSVHAADRAHG
jgi:hypothetical protein